MSPDLVRLDLTDAVGAALAAEPPVFCSGGSLDALVNRRDPLSAAYAGCDALAAAPVPTIAAVAGAAVGAGVNLPLACDVVLAGESARLDPRFLHVGIHPGGGHLWRPAARVGEQGAAAMVLCGDALTCVPDDELLSLADRFARRVARRSPAPVRRTEQTLRQSRGLSDPSDAAAVEQIRDSPRTGR